MNIFACVTVCTVMHTSTPVIIAYLCCWTQAAEDGRARETCHGAAEEENGERGAENDEKRAKDRCQTFITLTQRTGH